jgi:hypothetical protein
MTLLPNPPQPSELRDPPLVKARFTKQAARRTAQQLISEPGSVHFIIGEKPRSAAKAQRLIEAFLNAAGAKFSTDGHRTRLENGSELFVAEPDRHRRR